jgi:hypothetical protein
MTAGAAIMASIYRFGRRLNLPSTAQIKHELRMLILAERVGELQKEAAALESDHRLDWPARLARNPEQPLAATLSLTMTRSKEGPPLWLWYGA